MDALLKLPRETQIVLGGALLFVIFSFLDWQSASFGPFTVGVNLWHGFGVLVALVAIVLLAWEIARAFDIKVPTGSFAPGLVSAGLAALLLVLTVIVFLDWSQYRAWPEYLGLVLAIVIGVVAYRRARAEGVEMPTLPKAGGAMSMGGAAPTAPSAPPDSGPSAGSDPGDLP